MNSFCFLLLAILLHQVDGTLKTAQIFFRHGQRFPTAFLTFPTDEKKVILKAGEYDRGELTDLGIQQTFDLGGNIRANYGHLVGREYRSKNFSLITFTGRDNRTVASALSALAGLFPPSASQPWIPIPVFSLVELDEISFGVLDHCPHYRSAVNGTRGRAVFDRFADAAEWLSNQTGVEIPDIDRLQKVIDGVLARKNLAAYLPLPDWARDVALLVGLKQIQNILHQEFVDILGEAPGAWHFDRLIGAFEDFVNNRTEHKLVLYSGHDTNMMTFGRLLNITGLEEELQPLASYLAFELHSDDEDSQDYRIYLHRELNGTRERLHVRGCEEPCFFSEFRALGPRMSSEEFLRVCNDVQTEGISFYSTAAGILLVISILLLVAFLSAFYSCIQWKRRFHRLAEEERQPLLVRSSPLNERRK